MTSLFKRLFNRKQERNQVAAELEKFTKAAGDFGLEHKDTLVIMCDPDTDVIFLAYQGFCAPVRIANRDGSVNRVVHNAIKHTRNSGDIDRFLLAVDGGLFAIANSVYNNRKAQARMADWLDKAQPPAESKVKLSDGSVLSPIQVQAK